MPYKDPEKRREYDRERRRKARAKEREGKTPKNVVLPRPVRTAADLLEVLSEQIGALRQENLDTVVRARAIAYLANVTVRVIEVGDLEERLAALEEHVQAEIDEEV